jgi:hypothetical protein
MWFEFFFVTADLQKWTVLHAHTIALSLQMFNNLFYLLNTEVHHQGASDTKLPTFMWINIILMLMYIL